MPKRRLLSEVPVSEIAARVDATEKRCLIIFSGGEPFLFPDFVELCRLITRNHSIELVTNLSSRRVLDFAEKINPSKVELVEISLHISELKRKNLLNNFIDNIRLLKTKGFNIKVTYVMYPPLVKRFERDYDFFISHGVEVEPRLYRGLYRLRKYPKSYNRNEKAIISKYIASPLGNLLASKPAFKGKICSAGRSSVVIHHDGKICRCQGDQKQIGNFITQGITLFDMPKKCTSSSCPCPSEGLRNVL